MQFGHTTDFTVMSFLAVKASHLKLTQPHSPHLMTRQRSRPTSVKSSAELEAEEMEKQKK